MTNKLRAYDSKTLARYYETCSQIRSKVEAILKDGHPLNSLPPSVISTEELFNIVLCYEVMFDSLREEHLIKDGHLKPTDTVH